MTTNSALSSDPERTPIAETVTGMLHTLDRRTWKGVHAALADTVTTDYTSLFGGEVESQSAETMVEDWTVDGHCQMPLIKETGTWQTTRLTLDTAYPDRDRSLPEQAATGAS